MPPNGDDIPDEKKKEIRDLWRTPGFSGAFSGLTNFRTTLALNKNIHISRIKLFQIMQHDEDFILETKKKRKQIPRRPLTIHGFGNTWQADIAEMFPFEGYNSFLCCVDLFSRRIFCEVLKGKSAEEVKKAFKKTFQEAGVRPEKLETDRGSEFLGNRRFFRNQQIFFKIKVGKNKAAFAEHAIQVKDILHKFDKSVPKKCAIFFSDGETTSLSSLTCTFNNRLAKVFKEDC